MQLNLYECNFFHTCNYLVVTNVQITRCSGQFLGRFFFCILSYVLNIKRSFVSGKNQLYNVKHALKLAKLKTTIFSTNQTVGIVLFVY